MVRSCCSLRKRPFFAVVAVDAPLGLRARRRALKEGDRFSLEKMIAEEDEVRSKDQRDGRERRERRRQGRGGGALEGTGGEQE